MDTKKITDRSTQAIDQMDDKSTQAVNQFGTRPDLKPPSLQQTSYDGALLKGRYLIEGELGRGGIGVVYLARDAQLLQRRVVIKVLLQESENSPLTPWFKKKFEQEIEALVRLDHPGVVGVLDAGEMPDGKPFFVMQYVEGTSLRPLLRRGPVAFERMAHIIRQIGAALSAAHDKGIVHRDLKPENVMAQTGSDGEEMIKLIDFGIASVKDSQYATTSERTKVAGAVPYMAPEQLRGQPEAASDIWALGVMAYEMATGQLPFTADSLVGLHEQQKRGAIIRPSTLRPDLPPAAEAAILKALAFDSTARYPRARTFSEDLARALTGHPLSQPLPQTAPPATPADPVSTNKFDGSTDAISQAPTEVALADATAAAPQRITLDKADSATRDQAPPAKSPVKAIALAAAVVAVAFAAFLLWPRGKSEAPNNAPQQLQAATIAPLLNYSLRVREKALPRSAPIELAGEIIFKPGDELCLVLNSPRDGHLYLINEGPQPKDGLPSYNVMFPAPAQFTADAPSLRAGQSLFIPSENPPWFRIDAEQGTEKLWLVWAERAIPEMELVRKWLNEKDGGEIKDAGERRTVRDFLAAQTKAARPVAEKGEHQTVLKAALPNSGAALVYPVKLEHR